MSKFNLDAMNKENSYKLVVASEGDDFGAGHDGEVTASHAEGTLNGVEQAVLHTVKPDEVLGTIVVNVTVQVVALLSFFSFAMKGTADQSTDKYYDFPSIYTWIPSLLTSEFRHQYFSIRL